uniref:(California timema) hypothetical protein n=1 Tax=Timema californicum TaxID=61474 RepID=A0A7R9JK85_TIMCA|nr:unnamed protein product [Timema californicum]
MVGVMHYRDYGQTTTGCLSRPMFVLLSAGTTEEDFLLKVLQLGKTILVTSFAENVGQQMKTPRTPIWLVLTNETIPDEFFYGMYPAMSIPMASLVLTDSSQLASDSQNLGDGCIELEEVYRVQEEEPLTMIKLGTWNRETGLSWTDKTLIERRSDLQSAVIPALTRDVSGPTL